MNLNKERTQKCYHSKQYKQVRNEYIQEHPLCEECLKEGKITGTHLEIHHKTPILEAPNDNEMMKLCCDKNNLITLCEYHHHLLHNETRGKSNKLMFFC